MLTCFDTLGVPPPPLDSAALDMSLKKNTAFIRKVRVSLNAASLDSLITDIKTISLEKYLSEVISAFGEGLTKCRTSADFFTGARVRFNRFQMSSVTLYLA